jgi:cytochrome b561
MELFLIYVWLKIPSFLAGLAIFAIGCFGFILATYIGTPYYEDQKKEWTAKWKNTRKVLAGIAITVLVIHMLIPSKTDVAILVGAHYGMKLTNSDEGQKVWKLMRGKANELLDEELKKLEK